LHRNVLASMLMAFLPGSGLWWLEAIICLLARHPAEERQVEGRLIPPSPHPLSSILALLLPVGTGPELGSPCCGVWGLLFQWKLLIYLADKFLEGSCPPHLLQCSAALVLFFLMHF
jgi:hypothetical protein